MNQPRRTALAYLWLHHRPAVIGLGLALIVAALFVVRLVVFSVYWSDPAHRNQPLAGWMTPAYVAQSWDVDPDVIRAVLTPPPGARPTLAQIAEAEGVPLPELLARIEAAIAGARAP